MKVRYLDIDGVRTRILTAGEGRGDPLILLHGVGLSADTYARNLDVLGQDRPVVAMDMLGHGFTDAVDFDRPPQARMAAHVIGVADALGWGRFSVGGSSYGGLVAALAALADPARVTGLVLIGTGTVFHPADTREASLRAALANGRQVMEDADIDRCRRRMAVICHDPASVPEELLLVQASAYALPDRLAAYDATILGVIAAADDPDAHVTHRLEAFEQPVLIVTGRQDIRCRVADVEAGAARIRDAELKVYDACNHLPYLEHPARFNADVAAFLRRGEEKTRRVSVA